MNRLMDKLLIILLAAVSCFQLKGFIVPVSVLLTALVFTELVHILPGKFSALPPAVYSIACFFYPGLSVMLPVFVYDTLRLRQYPLFMFYPVCFAVSVPSLNGLQIVCTIICASISMLLCHRTSSNESLQKRLNKQRDESEEIRLLLSERNKNLLEKQDNEIYTATLKERNRIAREIHDNVGHILTRSILQMGALQIVNKDKALDDTISEIKETLGTAMTGIRNSVHDLHDTTIDLRKLLLECTAPLKDRFTVKLSYEISDDTHTNIKLCILGIVKEAVSNIVKHSNGNSVSISIHEHPAFYQLIVKDNGCNNGTIKNTGMGIAGMRERTENAGGIFNVISSKDEFRIFVSIPKSTQHSDKEQL